MKYVIYLRVSTKEQDNRTQEEMCLRYLKGIDNKTFEYVIYEDKVTSRKDILQRVGIQAALKALEAGDILVSQKIDRLARSSYEIACLIEGLKQKQAEIILIDQPGIKNKVVLGVYAGMAEEEVKMIRKRIKDKLETKRTRGERIGTVPYGYALHPTALVPVKGPDGKPVMKPGILIRLPYEQAVIGLIKGLPDDLSYRDMATIVNEKYVNRKGNPFTANGIWRIRKLLDTEATYLDQLHQG